MVEERKIEPTMAYQPPQLSPPPYNPEARFASVNVIETTNYVLNHNHLDNEQTTKLTLAFQYCRTIKTFAFIDLIFGFIYFFFYWPYIFANILILFGLSGAKYYKRNQLIGYLVFSVLNFGFRIYLFWLESNPIMKVFFILFAGIELYILHIIFKGYKSLGNLNDREIKILQRGWQPNIVVFRYY